MLTIRETTPYEVFCDIDHTAADARFEEKDDNVTAFFEKYGCIIEAKKTHYVFPGVIETLQLLFQMKDVRVSFFSAGHVARNRIFVRKLLVRTLGNEGY